MKFTFEEWKFIQHCIECASRDFEKLMNESTVSDKELSSYQIFKKQMEQAESIIRKINSAEI